MEWMKLLYILGIIVVAGLLFMNIRNNPQLFSKENISKSFFSLGILALLLIGFIALIVMWLRST
jgi:flagellar biogenesis protein FliO